MKLRWLMLFTLIAGFALGCGQGPYPGPQDAGDVELELQAGGWIYVPVDEIQTFEAGDNGTMVWTDDGSFVVQEAPGAIREKMQEARRQL